MNAIADEKYLKICSERTLQTNSKGFFMNFVQIVSENVGEKWIKNVFGRLKTDRERIEILYKNEKTKQPITLLSNVQEIYREKSAQTSQEKRLEAEKVFQNGELKKALALFSQSIIRAPISGQDTKYDSGGTLALSLWGRAQVLMSMEEYSHALQDIQQALKQNLPEVFKAGAYWKMAICYKGLDQENKAKVSFDLAEKLLVGNTKKIEELKRDRKTEFVQKDKVKRKVLPKIRGGTHRTYPAATKKISIQSEEGKGRYAVANQHIQTGETLVVELPYSACLLPEIFGTHCHHCFERVLAPWSCNTCASVAFCSSECKEAALSSYHKYECKYLDLLIGSGMSILSHTALRMITQNELERTLEICKSKDKDKVYSLCTNAEKRFPKDFLQRTLMAAFLLRCLQRSGYFGENRRSEVLPTEQEYCVGELLLFHLQMLQFNAHEIYETLRSPEQILKGSKPAYIGVAVYPTVALLNHDCNPAVTRHFVGKHIVIQAARPLQPNDVVAENYGPIFSWKSLQERQRSLSSRYWFNCRCQACEFDWPMLRDLDDVSKKVKCSNEKCTHYFQLPLKNESSKCPECKRKVTLNEHLRLLSWCEEQFNLGCDELNDPEKAIEILCKAIDVFYKISCPPHRGARLAQETLQICVASFGNVSEVLIKKSVVESNS